MKAELHTTPSFTFEQENAEGMIERPINVAYYNDNVICLSQAGNEIIICGNQVKELFREILRHHPEAQKQLKK